MKNKKYIALLLLNLSLVACSNNEKVATIDTSDNIVKTEEVKEKNKKEVNEEKKNKKNKKRKSETQRTKKVLKNRKDRKKEKVEKTKENKNKEEVVENNKKKENNDEDKRDNKETVRLLTDEEIAQMIEDKHKEDIANGNYEENIDLNQQELKARAQFLKDDNGGWVPEGELEPYDLPQPAIDGITYTIDNTNRVDGDVYDMLYPDTDWLYEQSINYSFPYGPIYPIGTENSYTINDLEYHGAMIWNGYKYTNYPESVLPGEALQIPGRHLEDGFVSDAYGYIVGASDFFPKGTVIDSPYGRPIRIYDVFAHNQPSYRIDVYVR